MYTLKYTEKEVSAQEYIRDFRDVGRFMECCRECRQYNTSWACPPYDFDTTKLIAVYDRVYILGTQIIPDDRLRQQSLEAEPYQELVRDILAEVRVVLDRELLLLEERSPGSRAFFAGNCFSCPAGACPRVQGNPCVQPEKMRYSLEAFGFDIGKTVSDLLSLELKWSTAGEWPDYFLLVSGLFFHTERGGNRELIQLK